MLKIIVELRHTGQKVVDITFAELLGKPEDAEQLQLHIIDSTFEVLYNQPWVLGLSLPSSLLAGFAVYPSKVELQFAERQHCKANWFRTKAVSFECIFTLGSYIINKSKL